MNKSPNLWLYLLVFSVCIEGLLATACSKEGDEQQIHHAIDDIVKAVEEKQAKGVLEYLTADFKAQGRQGTRDVRGMMFYYFRQYKQPRVYVSDIDIQVTGQSAQMTLKARVTGFGGLLVARGRIYRVATKWRKKNDHWRVTRARWEIDRSQ